MSRLPRVARIQWIGGGARDPARTGTPRAGDSASVSAGSPDPLLRACLHLEQVTAGEAETVALGRRLAEDLAAGDRVGIVGPLGAGKTAFVRGICEGLGVFADEVTSPTFAIVNTYRGRALILHVDLYRVSDIDEVESTGLLDLAETAVMLIEWLERVPELAEPGTIVVEIDDLEDDRRRISLGKVLSEAGTL